MKKSLGLWLCMVITASFPASAAGVSFLVIQTDQPGGNAAKQYAVQWENCLLEVFFNSGHIVSNAPILQIDEKPLYDFPDEAERDYMLAQEGGMDFFIVAIVDYSSSRVTLRLFSTKSQNLIREQNYTRLTYRSAKEEYEHIKKTVQDLTVYIP